MIKEISIRLLALVMSVLITTSAFAQVGIFDANIDVDGGNLGAVGTTTYDPTTDTYTITGSGHDIWDQEDDFQFVYKKWSGDFVLKTDVSLDAGTSTSEWAKACLMARQDLEPGSPNICTRVRPDGTYFNLQFRAQRNGQTVFGEKDVGGQNPGTHILERVGNVFTAYYVDENGKSVFVADENFELQDPILVGLAVTAHETGSLSTGTFRNVSLSAGAPSFTEDWELYH